MKSAIIMSSELAKHGRWDAGFHLLNEEYRDRADALSVTMAEDAVVTLLSDDQSVPTQALQFLSPLTRGNSPTPSREQLLRAVKDYPFLAMAVIKDKAAGLMTAKQVELAQQAEKLAQASQALSAAGPNIAGLLPIPYDVRPLLNKNSFVAGVVYFDGETLAIPVDTSPTAYVADCWVVDLADWTGPQLITEWVESGEVPVPRRREDLGKPVGYLEGMADHTVNYGRGWR